LTEEEEADLLLLDLVEWNQTRRKGLTRLTDESLNALNAENY